MLVHAGFADPVMDQEVLTLHWTDAHALLAELRTLGGNAAAVRHPGLRTPRWRERLLRELGSLAGADGKLSLSFEVAYGHAFRAPPRARPGEPTTVSLEDDAGDGPFRTPGPVRAKIRRLGSRQQSHRAFPEQSSMSSITLPSRTGAAPGGVRFGRIDPQAPGGGVGALAAQAQLFGDAAPDGRLLRAAVRTVAGHRADVLVPGRDARDALRLARGAGGGRGVAGVRHAMLPIASASGCAAAS